MLIIGLNGLAHSGKDTLAREYSLKAKCYNVAFADPLRAMISVLGVKIEDMLDTEKKNDPQYGFLGKSPRYLLQTLGTEWGRTLVNDNIWIEVAKRRIDDSEKLGYEIVFVTDCRFDNEAEAIKSWGGRIVRIIRPNSEAYQKSVESGGVKNHASEAGLKLENIDFTIYNDSTIKAMVDTLDEYISFKSKYSN